MLAHAALTCQVTVGLVFVLSVTSKVRGRDAYRDFTASVSALLGVRGTPVRYAAAGTVVAEAAVVAFVALGLTVAGSVAAVSGLLAAGLLAVFTAAIVAAMRRGARVPCRCFGASATRTGLLHVVRNLALLAVCGVALAGTPALAAARLGAGEVLISAGAAGAAALFVQRLADVVALFAPQPGAGRGVR